MKKSTLMFMGALLAGTVSMSAQTIATARAAAIGSTVTVRGIVTNGSELGVIRYLQDATDGIAIYGSNVASINRGDSIIATGVLTDYYNLLEITPVSYTVLATALPLPTPSVVTIPQFLEPTEGRLIQFNGVTFSGAGGNFSGNTNYTITAGSQSTQVRINSGSNLVGTIIPSGPVDVVGIGSQFTSTSGGYQLLPRDLNDIFPNSSIWLTSQPHPSNISPSGLTINWNTNIAGSYFIRYGVTPLLELGQLNGTGTSATPSVAISGTAATIYYAQVFSVNGTDTAKSAVKVFASGSNSTGNIKIYFNRTVDNTVSTGTNAVQNQAIADTLAAYINRTKSTLDITMYNWDDSNNGLKVTNAVNAAYARGVKVRVIYDGATSQFGVDDLNTAIHKVPSPQASAYGIMHNKFILMDVNSSNASDPIVWTGSTNMTNQQLMQDANSVIIIQDQSMARGYKLEFDEMWGDTATASAYNPANSRFGPYKTDNTPHEYLVNGIRIESFFSPSDGTTSHFIGAVGSANTEMYIAQMLITRTDIGSKVATMKNTNSSLNIKTILNDTSGGATPYWLIRNAITQSNIRINAFPWIFHHKYMIVDAANTASDPLLWVGSHNMSNAAEQRNDENSLIVHDATIANIYYQEFSQRWKDDLVAGISEVSSVGTAVVYPNPASDAFTVKIEENKATKADVAIYDLVGKQVYGANVDSNNGVMHVSNVNLKTGMYIVKVSAGNGIFTSRIMITQ